MTSKLVVNTIEADTGISSVSFASSISMSSTSKFHFSNAGIDIGADTNINRPTAGVLGFNINSSEKLRINSSGIVQIGNTENPTNYNVKDIMLGNHSGNHGLTILSGTGNGGYIMFSDNNGGGSNAYRGQIEYQHNGDYMRFITATAERLRITSAGKVGINTDGPSQQFTSYAASGYPVLANGPSNGIGLGGNGVIVFGNKDLASYGSGAIDASNFAIKISGSEKLSITSGNVNIGVNASSNPFTYLRFGGSQYGAADIRPTDEGSHKVGLAFYVDGTADTTINPTEKLRVNSSGSVGINETSPDTKLHITHSNATEDVLKLEANPVSAGTGERSRMIFQITQSNGQSMKLGHIASHSLNNWGGELAFHTKPANGSPNNSTSETMRLHANGAVTKPQTPAFMAYGGSQSISAGNYIVFTQENYDTQGNYNTSNGIFTAPIAGKYLFTITGLYTNNSSTPPHKYVWHLNNVNQGVLAEWQDGSISGSYNTIGNSSIIYQLAVNDTVRIYVEAGNAHISGGQTRYCGYLLG